MRWLKRYNESRTIKVTDGTIKLIVSNEIIKFGNEGDLNHIDVSGVTTMRFLFSVSHFNGDISRWNVGNVFDMGWMFNVSRFNKDVSNWDLSNVVDTNNMFTFSDFNGDISNWNMRNVQNMTRMFYYSRLQKKEPWWYVLSPLFNDDNYSMYDSLDFEWIDLEEKVIYKDKLIKTLKRSYNKNWNGELPKVFGFTYK